MEPPGTVVGVAGAAAVLCELRRRLAGLRDTLCAARDGAEPRIDDATSTESGL
jgi:hypothetical protein